MLEDREIATKLIFTDEKLFNNAPQNDLKLVRRKIGQSYANGNIQKQSKPTVTCMIWLYIGPFGKGEVFLAENNRWFDERGNQIKRSNQENTIRGFDNKSYTAMVENLAIPSIEKRILDYVFCQDNSRVHTALKNKGQTIYDVFRRNNVEYINDWPPNSPDLHPVENAHKLLQDEVNKELNRLVRKPKNKHQLFSLIEMCWNEKVKNEQLVKIYNTFLDRCRLCVANQGDNNFSTRTSCKKNKELLETFVLEDYLD